MASVKDVQSLAAGTGTTSNTSPTLPAFAVDPVNGDTIVVGIGTWNTAVAQAAPTDNYGNTYVQIGTTQRQSIAEPNAGMSMWMAANIVGGPGFVVTGHVPSSTLSGMTAWCLTGMAIAPYNGDWVFLKTGSASTESVGPTSPAPAANSIFIGFIFQDGSNGVATPSAGYTKGSVSTYAGVLQLDTASKISSTVETLVWTCAVGTNSVSMLASFAPLSIPPVISSVTPASGSTLGGTSVTINGSLFDPVATVSFGGTPATSVSVGLGGTTITCVTPAHAAGAVDVVVTNPSAGATATNAYTFAKPPAVLSPSKAIRGHSMDIYLESVADVFTVGTTAVVSGTGVTVNSTTRVNATHLILHLTIAAGATSGLRDITVTSP